MESVSRPPHRRKFSSSANGGGFSRGPYDDVLSSGQNPSKSKLRAHDYAEIFAGSGGSGNSIPVLDLSGFEGRPVMDECRSSSSKPDYSTIFGGFTSDDIGVSYQEMFGGGRKSKCSEKRKTPAPACTESPVQGSEYLNSSGKTKRFSSEASDQSTDGIKHFNMSFHKTSQISKDGSNGTTHIAELDAVPGFTYFVNGNGCPQKSEVQPSLRHEVSRTWSFSANISEGKPSRKTELHFSNKQRSDNIAKNKDESTKDGSNLPDRLFDLSETNLKSFTSEIPSSSSPTNLNDQKVHKRSKASDVCPKIEATASPTGDCSPPFFEGELDVNSDAAASAAALKKAIEKAQESIRLAKQIMERKKEGLQDGSKPSSKGCLKVKVKKEDSINLEANTAKAKNVKQDAFVDTCRKLVPPIANSSMLREAGNAEMKKPNTIVEPERVNEGETRSPQVVHNGKHRRETSSSGQVDCKSNFQQCTDKLAHDLVEAEASNETLKERAVISHQAKGHDDIAESRDSRRDIKYIKGVSELEENVGKSSSARMEHKHEATERPGIVPEDKVTTSNQNDSKQQEKPEMKFKEHQEITNSKTFESRVAEVDHLLRESMKPTEETKEPEEEELELGSISQWEENGCASQNICDEETLTRHKGAELYSDFVEESGEALCKELDGKGQQVLQETEASQENLDEVREPEIDEIKISEAEGARGAPTGNERGKDAISLQESAHQDIIDTAFDAAEDGDLDVNTKFADHQDCYRFEIKDNGVEENQGTASCETDVSVQGETQAPCASKNDKEAEDRPPEAQSALSNEMSETSDLFRDAAKENFVPNKVYDAYEDLSSDGCSAKPSSPDSNHNKQELPRNEDMFRREVEIAEERSTAININQDSTEVHPDEKAADIDHIEASLRLEDTSTAHLESSAQLSTQEALKCSGIDITDVGHGKKYASDSVEESASVPNNESKDALLSHRSEECAEGMKGDIVKEEEKDNIESTSNGDQPVEDRSEGSLDEQKHVEDQCEGSSQSDRAPKRIEESMESDKEQETKQNVNDNKENLHETSSREDKRTNDHVHNVEREDHHQRIEAIRKGREREKDRIAVERAIREARERAFAEARERAERASVERAAAEARQRAMAEAREKLEKASTGAKPSSDKASIEAKLRAERAAVGRATAEARERALEKAMSQKTSFEARALADGFSSSSGGSKYNGLKHSFSSSDLERLNETNNESAQRRKARLERHQRIMERVAKALAEKNMRDRLAQKEQAERNRLAESLDADIKRWATGKEGNLRALLSTLQYILGPDSGWQPITLTEIITTPAVKKAYRKATLYVHPDKLQQRGASIQQKYICEKVFDLLKAAWNKFNSEER